MPATAVKTTKKCAQCKKDRTVRAYNKANPTVCWHCRQADPNFPLRKLIAAEQAAQDKDAAAILKLQSQMEERSTRISALRALLPA
jgi:hypothetical protein